MIILLIAIVVIVLLKELIARNAVHQPFPYKKKALLSHAERSFYGVLSQAVGDRFVILSKVVLYEFIGIHSQENRGIWQTFMNKINQKNVDFIICDSATMDVLLVIELDDKSHDNTKRRDRDAFVDKVMAIAEIPILHFKARHAYSITDLRSQVLSSVGIHK